MFWILLLVVCIPLLHIYFSRILNERKQRIDHVFVQIDDLFRQRYELLPGLIALTRNYTKDETPLINQLASLRGEGVGRSLRDEQKVELDNKITKPIQTFMKILSD